MEDYALTTDMSKVYEESYKKVFTYIQQLEPKQEYTAFIQENKWWVHLNILMFNMLKCHGRPQLFWKGGGGGPG